MPSGRRGTLTRADQQSITDHGGTGLPPAPSGTPPAVRRFYEAMRRELTWLVTADQPLALQIAYAEVEAAGYRKVLAEQGSTYTEPIVTPRGQVVGERPVARPEVTMLRRAESSLAAARTQLGVTPERRARLGLHPRELADTRETEEERRDRSIADQLAAYRRDAS